MAATRGREIPTLKTTLQAQAAQFDFFQAVRLLERQAEDEAVAGTPPRAVVGRDADPDQEIVRFRAQAALSFPAAGILGLRRSDVPAAPVEMTTTFFGLTGPQGVLPQHYTTLLIQRLRERDSAIRDFFDLFHHRLVSLFYRAWEKHRHYVGYERRARRVSGEDDLLTAALLSLVGLGTDGLRGRLRIDDQALVFYSGHFAHAPRSASALEAMLADYFGVPLAVEQFQGRWLYLGADDCSRMPSAAVGLGQHCRLGHDLIVGQRVWDVQSKFRLRVGPLGYADFADLMPSGRRLLPMCQMTRQYTGPEWEFDVQVVLRREEVPQCGLDGLARLGWNTWVRSQTQPADATEAVFRLAGV